MKFDTNDLKENLKNYQKKATDQFKNFAENDWPDIKDHLTEKAQQAGDFLKQNGLELAKKKFIENEEEDINERE